MERYSRVYYSDDYLYVENSPVIILAGAILKDNTTNGVLGQLKMKSLSNQIIKAVEIELELYDASGKKQEKKVKHEFLDLNVSRNMEFGSKEAIELPYNNARSFKVSIKKVLFSDGKSWSNKKIYTELEKQERLNSILDSIELDYFKRKYGKFAKYIPIEQKSVWMCTCGTINHEGEQECCLCRLDRDTILDIDFEEEKKETVYYVSISYLETSNIGLIKVAEENFKQLKKYKDSKKKCEECLQKIQTLQQENKRWKKLMIIFACIIIAICATAFVFDVVIPNKKYQDVQRLIYNEEYAKAIEKIEELPKGYKDTSELLEKCYMSYAEQLVEEKKFEEALELYEQMEKKFEELFDASQQQKDIEIKNAIKKTKYQYANYLLENEKYEEAYNIYSELDGYLDSIYDKKKECASKLGDIALENKEYDKAVNWYELAKNTELGNEAKYEYVKEHNNSTDTKTYEYLVMLSKAGYKDSLSIYNQLYDVSCKVIINSKENDTSSSPLKFKQYDATYIHYQITGNVPAGAGNIRLEYERADTKNAKDDVYTHSSKDAVPIGEWQLEEVTFYPSGYYYKISIYNSDTDEKICSSKKVYVSDD